MKRKRQRLAQRRKMAGYSQEQLAEVLRVERSTVARWERAVAAAHAELRKGFAAMYGQADVRDPKAGLASAQIAAEQSRSVSNALGGLSLLHVGEAYVMLGESASSTPQRPPCTRRSTCSRTAAVLAV